MDLDAWYKDQKKYEEEGLGDPASTLPGMVYRARVAGDYKSMAWSAFRVFNITKLHAPLFRVCVPLLCGGNVADQIGNQIMLGTKRFYAREERNNRRPPGLAHFPTSRRSR